MRRNILSPAEYLETQRLSRRRFFCLSGMALAGTVIAGHVPFAQPLTWRRSYVRITRDYRLDGAEIIRALERWEWRLNHSLFVPTQLLVGVPPDSRYIKGIDSSSPQSHTLPVLSAPRNSAAALLPDPQEPFMHTAGTLRTVLSDCGDGIPVVVNGRPILSAQVRLIGGVNTLELLCDPTSQLVETLPEAASPDAAPPDDAEIAPELTEAEVMAAGGPTEADLPPLVDDTIERSDDPDSAR